MQLREQLEQENEQLQDRLLQLHRINSHTLYRVHQERSISECSTSTNSSYSSLSSTSSVNSEESGKHFISHDF